MGNTLHILNIGHRLRSPASVPPVVGPAMGVSRSSSGWSGDTFASLGAQSSFGTECHRKLGNVGL